MAALTVATPCRTYARDQDQLRRDEVRHAVEAGKILSLAEILEALRGKLPGEIAGVEIEQEDGRWLYEFRVVDGQGRLFEVYVDAHSGEIEGVRKR